MRYENDVGEVMFGKFFKLVFWLLILAVVTIALTPLNLYYDKVERYTAPISLQGVSGTAVKGSAETLKYHILPMGQAEWLLYPNWFDSMGGRMRIWEKDYDLTFQLEKIKKQTFAFDAIRGFVDWDLIKKYVQMAYGHVDGYFSFDLRGIRYDKQNGIKGAAGSITLKDFKITQPRIKELGEVTIDFKTEKAGVIVGTISSQSDVLNVSGTIFLQPNRYQINIDIMPKAGHHDVNALFRNVGSPRRGGGRKLNLAGFY